MTPEGLTALASVERPSNPFPGLRPFEFGESHLYFGRDGQSDQLIRKLAATRFVAVVGTSGSGKSSLVRAGLLPDLFSGFMTGAGSHWRVALMRPGNDPLGNLAHALCSTEVFGSEIEENARIQEAVTEATLRRGGLGLIEAVRQNRMPQNESLLVVVDQFEELFRFARVAASEQYRYEAAAFVKLLLEAARQREQNVYVVLTMRSDFLGDCSIFWDLPEAINEGQFLIPRMTRDQRAEAITGPVAVCGGRIEQRLVNRLLNDTGDNPDLLPILQHALMRTWENRAADHAEGEAVDLRHYEAVGTMSGALSRHADEAYNELPNERSRQIAERVFKALTEKGEDNREVRRPTVLKDLCALTGASVSEVVPVIEVFRREGRSFLMPPASVVLDEESLIDISHESLIRNWARLKGWVDEESKSAQIYTRLAETAVLHEHGQAGLWRDPDLQLALDWRERTNPTAAWAARYHPSFDASMEFLDASVNARDAAALEEERRRRREIRRTRVAAVIFFLLFMLSLAALTYANVKRKEAQEKSNAAEAALARVEQANAKAEAARVYAVKERDRANEQTDIAKRNEELAKGATGEALKEKKTAEQAKADAVKSAEVARLNARRAEESRVEAEKQKKNAEVETAKSRQLLYDADVNLAQQAYETLKVNYGRERLLPHAPGQGDNPGFEWLYLWRVLNSETATIDIPEGESYSTVDISRDGRLLVAATGGDVLLWDVASGREAGRIVHGDTIYMAMALSPDGKTLARASQSAVTLFDVASRKELSTFEANADGATRLVFAPDNKTLAVAGDNYNVRLWDVAAGREKMKIDYGSILDSVAFSPDGATLAAGGMDGGVKLWDAASGKELLKLNAHNSFAEGLAFSLDGTRLVTAGGEGDVKFWDVRACGEGKTCSPLHTFAGNDTAAVAAVFSPDGRILAAGYSDGTVRIWDAASYESLATLTGRHDLIHSMAFTPDGNTLVTSGPDKKLEFWDVKASVREQAALKGHAGGVTALALSPDGKTLATGSVDNTIKFWDVATHAEVGQVADEYPDTVRCIAYSPDGSVMAAGSDDGTLMMWDVAGRKALGEVGGKQGGGVASVAFSPDGARLLVGARSGALSIWDVKSQEMLTSVLTEHINAAVFAPDGKTVVAGFTGGAGMGIWDAALSKKLAVLKGQEGSAYSLAFSPSDERVLAVGYDNGNVELWNTATRTLLATLHGDAVQVYSVAFSRDGKTLAVGGGRGIRLWDTSSFKELITLKGHDDIVMALAFSLDGNVLASGSFDHTARIWRAATVEEVKARQRQQPQN